MMNQSRLLGLLFALVAAANTASAQWQVLFTPPAGTNSNHYLDRRNPQMLAVGVSTFPNGYATVHYSLDGGQTWSVTPPCPQLSEDVQGIFCPTDTTCFLSFAGNNTYIASAKVNLQTGVWSNITNGSFHWRPKSIYCTGNDTCYALCNDPWGGGTGAIYKTTNGFVSRSMPAVNDSVGQLGTLAVNSQAVVFPSNSVGYAKGQLVSPSYPHIDRKGGVLKTTDAGLSWQLIWYDTTTNSNVTSIDFLDDLRGIITTGPKAFLTDDGGVTWSDITPPGLISINSFSYYARSVFRYSTDTLFLSNRRYLYQSNDKGLTWLRDTINASNSSYRLLVTSDNSIYLENAGFIKRTGLLTGVSERLAAPVTTYPNPVTDYVQVENCESCTYQILTLTGAVVQSGPVSGNQIPVSSLPNAVYHLQLSDLQKTQTMKLVKME